MSNRERAAELRVLFFRRLIRIRKRGMPTERGGSPSISSIMAMCLRWHSSMASAVETGFRLSLRHWSSARL